MKMMCYVSIVDDEISEIKSVSQLIMIRVYEPYDVELLSSQASLIQL